MAGQILPQKVADAFVEQYYIILNKSPEYLHKFYQESSLVGWPEPDGVVKPVTTLSGINDMVMSSGYKNWPVEISTVDAQESLEGGVIVAVTGLVVEKDNLKKNFSQTFFLAKQEKGFFVLNDILRFFDVCEAVNDFSTNSDEKNNQAASSVEISVPSMVSNSPAIKTDAEVENKNGKEALDLSVSKETKVEAPKISTASPEKVGPVLAPASNAKVEAPKISYASMVAKVSPLTSPKTLRVSPKTDNQASAPSMTRPSARGDVASKVSTPNGTPKLPIVSNGASSSSAYNSSAQGEGREIYIGGLPHDITKKGVVEVVKKFGPVRRSPDCVQIRRHEDGFCCGFVEFESAEAARRAVEAHHVMFGDKEAYVTFKRSYFNRGNDGRGRSLTRGGFRNGNLRSRENDEATNELRPHNENRTGYGSNGLAIGPRHSGPSNQWYKDEGRAAGHDRSS